MWVLKNKPKPQRPREHWFLSKFKNRYGAKLFNLNDFNSLADWSYGGSPSGKSVKRYKTKCGNIIECDSKSELKILDYLDRSGVVSAVGGQSLIIDYSTHFKSHNNYSPDIVILTNKGHLGIIEVKPTIAMSYHLNVEKYNALKQYCEENGFVYMMVDPDSDYMTFEEFCQKSIPDSIRKLFVPMEKRVSVGLTPYFHFSNENIEEWYKSVRRDYNRKEFELLIHALIIQKGWFNTFDRGFNVYSRPVKLDYKHDVIEYI